MCTVPPLAVSLPYVRDKLRSCQFIPLSERKIIVISIIENAEACICSCLGCVVVES
jgi:hypothetical protein